MLTLLEHSQSWLHRLSFGKTGGSTQAAETEDLYVFILWVNIISMVMLMIPMLWFAWKYHRSRQKTNYERSPAHNTPLELAWSIIPLLIMVPIFFWGYEGYLRKLAAPTDSEEITIRGQKWNWTVTYRNGAQPAEFVALTHSGAPDVPVIIVPANRPVKLLLSSSDVIHAFFIPDFRTKIDVTPNRFTSMWFQAMDEGEDHEVFCAEYCGENHSEMAAVIRVVSSEVFESEIHRLATEIPEGTCEEVGAILAKRRGCLGCHSVDGSKNTGPTWKDHFGNNHTYSDGSSRPADENSVRDNILYSQKSIVQGFPTSMPIYAGQLKQPKDGKLGELDYLLCYIKSLSSKGGTSATPSAAPAAPAAGSTPAAPKPASSPAH